tara:strand:- start:1203 stop:2117 length:915 start_codon:yes stop_codon:yes gene_type:complete
MKKSFTTDYDSNEMRLDRWIRNNIGKLPQSLIEKKLRNGQIKVNSKKVKSSYKIKYKDNIDIFNLDFKPNLIIKKNKFNPSKNIIKENEKLIIDNNDDFIVINKNSGISVQGGTKSNKNLIDIFSKSKYFENSKPFSVHRLDKDTSGVFLLAKNRETAQLITSLFRLRKVHKVYIAICHGEINDDNGELNNVLIRYEGKKIIKEKAKTIFKVLDKNSSYSLLEMQPITGRKHQLRKQLYQIGHPIYGDQKYKFNIRNKYTNKDLMLHSYQIRFMINNNKFTYRASLPNYFQKFLKIKKLSFLNS